MANITLADILRDAEVDIESEQPVDAPEEIVAGAVPPIDKGIPVPDNIGTNSRKYPLSDMEVGDSFLLESDDKRAMTNRIRAAIGQYTRRGGKGRRFVTRCVDGGVRCWRVQ